MREHDPGFVMIISDVIYPAGDVDDYVDGVYRPYRGEPPHFRVDAPLLGLPGNHDWYDGLAGFMYHFCDRDLLPLEAYTPPKITPGRCWPGRSASCGGGRPSRRRRPSSTMTSGEAAGRMP